MNKFLCFLFGHKAEECSYTVLICARCNSVDNYYGSGEQWTDFEREGLIGYPRAWWFRVTWPIRERFALRCDHCNQRIPLWKRRYNGRFCNADCFEAWIPF